MAHQEGAMACRGQGRERIKSVCMKGAPRFQPLAVESRIKSSAVLGECVPFYCSHCPSDLLHRCHHLCQLL